MTKPPPKTGPTDARTRPPTSAETELWQEVTGDVAPLGPGRAKDTPDRPPKSPAKKRQATARPQLSPPPPSPPPLLRPAEPEFSHGSAPGLDRRTQTRLKRGQIEMEARIDLHGMTQDQAHQALLSFLGASRSAGRRAVLVITGKGLRSGQGVLRDAVPRWLNEPETRRMIRAFSFAAPKDGGGGALYVLLKRQK